MVAPANPSTFGVSVEALFSVGILELGLHVAPCVVSCCLLAPFFARRREAPRALCDIIAHAGLFLRNGGVAASLEKVDAVLDIMELRLDRVR